MLSAVQRSTLHLQLRLSIQLGSVYLSHDPRPAKANSARSGSGSAEPDATSRETSGGPAPPAADGPRVKHGSKLKLKERSGVRLLMSAPCCCLPACPLLTPLFPASKAATFLSTAAIPSSRRLLKLSSYAASNKRWRLARVSCFKHGDEDSSTTNEKSERLESKLADELERAKSNEPSAESNDWISNIQRVVSKFFTLHAEPWIVPWTGETIIQVMLLWIASFCFVGTWIIPFLAHAAGFSRESLTHRGQALYSLLTDIAEGLAGIAILHRCLARFQPLPSGWFHFSLKGSWQFDVGVGCLLFPLVNFLSEININIVPVLPAPPGGVSGVEQSIVAGDSVAMALYAVVVSVCAPVWEEIIFRGFLLPSLTRYMPLWSSIMVSAVAFALAHFNIQRLLPLVFLGVVMGVVFARSRNLLPSMLLHSLWNSFVFLDLMK